MITKLFPKSDISSDNISKWHLYTEYAQFKMTLDRILYAFI